MNADKKLGHTGGPILSHIRASESVDLNCMAFVYIWILWLCNGERYCQEWNADKEKATYIK